MALTAAGRGSAASASAASTAACMVASRARDRARPPASPPLLSPLPAVLSTPAGSPNALNLSNTSDTICYKPNAQVHASNLTALSVAVHLLMMIILQWGRTTAAQRWAGQTRRVWCLEELPRTLSKLVHLRQTAPLGICLSCDVMC